MENQEAQAENKQGGELATQRQVEQSLALRNLQLSARQKQMFSRMERLKKTQGGKGGKALAAKAVSSFIKESHFFYFIAFVLALIDDIGDFFTFSFPVLDFITGVILLALVYPYIANNTIKFITYMLSVMDFVPLVGFMPFWTLATIYAWYKWHKAEQEKRAEQTAAGRETLLEAALE